MSDIVQVEGLQELDRKLKAIAEEYGDKAAKSPIRSALRKAGKVLQQRAQQRVRVKTGTLKENIIVTNERKPRLGQLEVKVTVRSKAKGYKDNARNRRNGRIGKSYKDYGPLYYARFLEFGTSHQPAYPFLRPAFEESKSSLPNMIRDDLSAAIENTVRRLQR